MAWVSKALSASRAAKSRSLSSGATPMLSWRCPGSRTKRTRFPSASTRATILVVSPPLDRPMACVRVPPRAPVPCWCTRTIVPSTITYSKSASADTASKILPKTPSRLHRRNLRKAEFHFPKDSGRSRHGAPTRTIQRTASRKSRLSAADLPGSPALPGTCGAIRSHWSSRRTIRSKGHLLVGSLEPNVSSGGNSPIDFECQQALAPECPKGKVVQNLLPVAGLMRGQQRFRRVPVEGVVRFVEPVTRALAVAEDPFKIALGTDPVVRPAVCSPRPRTGSDQGSLGVDGGGGSRME